MSSGSNSPFRTSDLSFRTPEDKCEVCESREDNRKLTLPFKKRPVCPECETDDPLKYKAVCTGGRGFVIIKPTCIFWWKFGGKRFTCDLVNSPRHFHLECRDCGHRWMMISASEK